MTDTGTGTGTGTGNGTGRTAPWPVERLDPGGTDPTTPSSVRSPAAAPGPGGSRLRQRLAAAVAAVDAPDVVVAVSRHGRRTVHCGGTAPPPPAPREELRYELGSASKTYTGLLLAQLTHEGPLTGNEPAAACLDPARRTVAAPATPAPQPVMLADPPITLAHLITHTSGLPALPAGFLVRALPVWRTNPYARCPDDRVIDAFLRHRPRHRPGTRWCYSNFGVAVLGHALAAVTGTPWEDLLTGRVLGPLGLSGTAPHPAGPGVDATGHRKDGRTPTPALDAGGFQAAGAVRATPHDLLTFLEAHLDPAGSPLAGALSAVRLPVLRCGRGRREVHTMTWFQHPADGGPMYFHGGATLGQQAFLGFRPDTGTAVAAVCTRRFRVRDPFVTTAYALLAEE
ncbi:serine hydrolase domain-containing protein [Streptomyces poonensis]|uniref:Penicillin-binding protein n=1 Tax=Streptomyces poonensis TaxID=68255 RepID=A0A918UF64_9ACTN|nr:serine hydrolase domain-containing protein [Streptomyces poonensis]GGY99746.1 penicillin-binding protein [Streptomyces poonensis]GLJ92202.1 penicillin-binding protein [Streptomyces poonensis]